MYTSKTFSPSDLPKIGQRVRTTAPLSAFGGVHVIPAGTLCDITAIETNGNRVRANAYPSASGYSEVVAAPQCFESVRGKPFVAGIDDRRRDGTNPSNASLRTLHNRTREDVADALSPAASVETALETIRAALTTPSAPAVDLSEIEGNVEHLTTRIDGLREEHAELDTRLYGMAGRLDSVATLATQANARTASIETSVAALTSALTSATPATIARAAVIASATTGAEPILNAILPYYRAGAETPFNVLLCSAPSLGKSYAIRKLGKTYDVYLEHGCADDIDEIPTLLGSATPDSKGGFILVDGVIVEGMRAAAAGKTVLLLMDEILREPQRVQEWLLTFLTGIETPAGKIYRVRTRKPTADGTLEVIEAPAKNFHLIAATNLGITPPIEAFWSRWYKVRLPFSVDTVREVATAVCDAHGITEYDKLVTEYAQVVMASREAVKNNRLRFPVDIRTLVYACKAAPEATGQSVGAFLARSLADQSAHWDIDTGDTLPDSITQCEEWHVALTTKC